MTDESELELNTKIVASLAMWVKARHGAAKLAEIAKAADIDPAHLEGATHWVSVEQVERFCAGARALVTDDADFVKACGEYFHKSLGPVRYMVWALSERQFFEAAAKTSKFMTRVSRFEVVKSEPTAFVVRYYTEKKESRLLCLSRQASWIYGPSIWGMPPAQLQETSCVARGDAHCEYHLRWFERRRLLPALAGIAVGAASAAAFSAFGASVDGLVVLPILGAAFGYIYELRRIQATNLAFGQEVNEVFRELGRAEAEARSELLAFHQREREWIRVMEHQVNERTTTLERVVEGLDSLQQNRVSTIRGFSHDLRNPLFVIKGNTQFLRERITSGDDGEALRDMETAAVQIEAMLARLMEVATQDTGFVKLTPKTVPVAPLADTLRRRLKALVHGRDIKVTVFCTREAPDQILIDRLVFDRVVDNLLTNAAKYTHKGSILLEIGGTPHVSRGEEPRSNGGYLTLKLSDTGEGIPPVQVERIFRPRAARDPSTPNSYGIGLSSVVRLLAQVGGRIDLMSKPGLGTTFWAHFPVEPPDPKQSASSDENLESMITRVVTIRKVEGV